MERERDREGGFIFVLCAAGLLIFVCAMAGLAVDAGLAFVAKGELQTAADAAALAGAGALGAVSAPDFYKAAKTATDFGPKNQIDPSHTAGDLQVETGYWNLDTGLLTSFPSFACAGTTTPCVVGTPNGCACEQRSVPAVKVTAQKTVPTYLAKVVGWTSYSPKAVGVAAIGYPSSGQVSFPFAVTKCMVDYYEANNQYGNSIQIPNVYASVPGCYTGNWSPLSTGGKGAKDIQDLLAGSTVTLNIGDQIIAQQGVKDTLYQTVADNYIGKTVIVPEVADSTMTSGNPSAVMGFMEFTITEVQAKGADKYITGTFQQYVPPDPNATGIGGTVSNATTLPMLLK